MANKRGSITIEFFDHAEPITVFEGDIQPTDISASKYHITMRYMSDYQVKMLAESKARQKLILRDKQLAEEAAQKIKDDGKKAADLEAAKKLVADNESK